MKKRAELHLHTKLSDDVSVIGVSEIFEKAEELGIEAIAFTNLNNAQDFPEVMKYAKKHENIKVIYGAEVQYKTEADSPVYHLTLLAKNQTGIKELYRVISSIYESGGVNLIDLQVLKENRNDLLVGSCGNQGRLYDLINKDSMPCASTSFYDYFEIFPSEDVTERETNKKIFYLGEKLGVPVVAVSNGHYISKEDKICCDIISLSQNKDSITTDKYYVYTSAEMLKEFSYLGDCCAEKAVLRNPQILIDDIENAKPLRDGNYYPVFENAYHNLEKICNNKAHEIYGNPLPDKIKERLDAELNFLKDEKTATQYLLAKKLTTFAKENGQLTTTRGAVGSTLVAFLLGISEANPLPPHYCCSSCHHFEMSSLADDGFDLPQKICPNCREPLKKDGHNIPCETFMGLNGDKFPDIDLNFPENFILDAQRFITVCFGKDKIAKAGTVSTIQDIIADRYIREYENAKNTIFKPEEREKLKSKITGVKKGVGMHPVGIMVIPHNMDFEDFTPLNQNWAPHSITHFDFNNLYGTILKQDVLDHYTLDLLLELEKLTGKTASEVDFDDPEIYAKFRDSDVAGVHEFENDFIKKLLLDLQPQNFNDLVKIISLAHGTNVWVDNAEHLIKNGVCTLSEVIASREDIMIYLTNKGMDRDSAFHIMDATRKGLWARKFSNKVDEYLIKSLKKAMVPDWFIESISKIHYMFPKAHSVAYVMNSVRLMWFKTYYPKAFETALNKIKQNY